MGRPPDSPEMRNLKAQRAAIVDKLAEQSPYLDAAKSVHNPDHQSLTTQYNEVNKTIFVESGNPPELYKEASDQRDNGTQEVTSVETPDGTRVVVTTQFLTHPSGTAIPFRQGPGAQAAEKSMLGGIRKETGMHTGDDNTHINPAENGADLGDANNVRAVNGHMQRIGTIRDAEKSLTALADEQGEPIKTTIVDVYDPAKGTDRPERIFIQAEDGQGNVLTPQNVTYANPFNHLTRSDPLDRPPQGVEVLRPGELRAVPTSPTLAVVTEASNLVPFPTGGPAKTPGGGPSPSSPGGGPSPGSPGGGPSPSSPGSPGSGPSPGSPGGGPSGPGR